MQTSTTSNTGLLLAGALAGQFTGSWAYICTPLSCVNCGFTVCKTDLELKDLVREPLQMMERSH